MDKRPARDSGQKLFCRVSFLVVLLEDHAGDVLRKARLGCGIPLERVAAAARMRTEQLARFEERGEPSDGIDFGAVSKLLDLDGAKLRRIAEGWLPAAHELSRWQCLRKIENDTGGMAVNCYLLWDRSSRESALFDTGWVAGPIADLLEQCQLALKHIFITHSHHDHVAALGELRKQAPDAAVHSNSSRAPKSQQLTKGECFSVGELNIAWRETPGHAVDGVTYVVDDFPDEAPPVAVVGDAVFAGSIGGALNHFELARQRVREEILTLPEASLICPGHGPVTTVGEQRDCNPFFPALVESSGSAKSDRLDNRTADARNALESCQDAAHKNEKTIYPRR